jgi:hypothetical protein
MGREIKRRETDFFEFFEIGEDVVLDLVTVPHQLRVFLLVTRWGEEGRTGTGKGKMR